MILQVIRFLLARAIPALINIAALAMYSRWLSPEEYGVYTLVISSVALTSGFLFQWIGSGLIRFIASESANRLRYLSASLTLFISILFLALLLLAVIGLHNSNISRSLYFAGVALLIAESWHILSWHLAIAASSPFNFGLQITVKSSLSLAMAGILVHYGYGPLGVVYGVLIGTIVAGLLPPVLRSWQGARPFGRSTSGVWQMAKYGAPLCGSIVGAYLIQVSDRFFLAYYGGAADVGSYAVGYDLATFTITSAMMIVNMAAYPLVIRELDKGRIFASARLASNLNNLLWVTLPLLACLVIFSTNITSIVLGAEFHETSQRILPWIAIAAFLNGIRSYHVDVSYHLAKNTIPIVTILLVSAFVNALLNMALIPRFSVDGAIAATIISYILALILSVVFSTRYGFGLPPLSKTTLPIVSCVVIAAVVSAQFADKMGIGWLTAQFGIFCVAYLICSWYLDIGNIKSKSRSAYSRFAQMIDYLNRK